MSNFENMLFNSIYLEERVAVLNQIEVKELSFSLFGASVTFGKKSNTLARIEKQSNEVKQEVLRELFVIRHILSDFYFRYEALNNDLINLEPNDEDRLYVISNKLFPRVFQVYSEISTALLGSKYFILMEAEERNSVLNVLDYITSERVSMEEIEDYALDPDEQVALLLDLNKLFDQVNSHVDAIIESMV